MVFASQAALQAAASGAEPMLHGYGLDCERLDAPFPLWLLRVPDFVDERVVDCLAPAERGRAARFRSPLLQRRHLATHGMMRLLGERCFAIPAACQRYHMNAFGKPELAPELEGGGHARCSISYSGGLAVVAWWAGADIGVDIEQVRPVADAADLIALHCTPREQAWLASVEPDGLDRAFLDVWVRKEACMKAVGKGLAIAPSSFDSGAGAEGVVDVGIDGKRVESGICDRKGDLMVAWARLCLEA